MSETPDTVVVAEPSNSKKTLIKAAVLSTIALGATALIVNKLKGAKASVNAEVEVA